MAFEPPRIDPYAFRGPDVMGSLRKGMELGAGMDRLRGQNIAGQLIADGVDPSSQGFLSQLAERGGASYIPEHLENVRTMNKAEAEKLTAQKASQDLEADQMGRIFRGPLTQYHQADEKTRQDPAFRAKLMTMSGSVANRLGHPQAKEWNTDPANFDNWLSLAQATNPDVADPRFANQLKMDQDTNRATVEQNLANNAPPTQAQMLNDDRERQSKRFDQKLKLRQDYQGSSVLKEYGQVSDAANAAAKAMGRDDKLADLDLIYGAMKVIDPTSVVREGEAQMVVNAQSPAQKYMGLWNSALGGARLTPDTRKELWNVINGRYSELAKRTNKHIDATRGFAKQDNFGDQEILGDNWAYAPESLTPAEMAASTPVPGAGGMPSNTGGLPPEKQTVLKTLRDHLRKMPQDRQWVEENAARFGIPKEMLYGQ